MKFGSSFPVRVRFDKRGRVRWISHRDVARAFERAFRIEALPLAFSEGFSPRPKVSFGLALPTGAESDDEYLDVCFAEAVDLDRLPDALSAVLPIGIRVLGVAPLEEGAPALQDAVNAVRWELEVVHDDAAGLLVERDALADALAHFERADSIVIPRTRKGRTADGDVRAPVRHIELLDNSVVAFEANTHLNSIKPVELLRALAHVAPALGELTERRLVRTHQWIERDGARLSPLDADTRPRVPEARAS